MGSQSRPSLKSTGPGNAHYTDREIGQIKIALESPPTVAGKEVSVKILLSALAATNPFFATILSAISILVIIQKIIHYAEIAEREGTEAAVFAIIKDIADGAIRQYITDEAMELLIESGSISLELKEQIGEIVGAVVDQSIDQVEEAFLNE
ncbi:MAG: hypothetical protein ABSB80_12410 [Methanoregula sp.]|jgi:hypothetical protein|uniref:hypothetical protein n=1 Tax=Methanoregula sp. TaxID=2052170 RepID=UPI003D11E447